MLAEEGNTLCESSIHLNNTYGYNWVNEGYRNRDKTSRKIKYIKNESMRHPGRSAESRN